ncbi:GC-rich sequence DNA-binding factor 2 [Betta splendens]|uniref:GC-rich sequence DNA-binding factor 2 n=1 Tax=Betta splendens TaxID=158456 RepID=A0A6P7M3W7_BETSP|nr:GC-rich sequence DNA-binding factor 2 [Betta splendens]
MRAHYIARDALRVIYVPFCDLFKRFTTRRTRFTFASRQNISGLRCLFKCGGMFNKKPRRNFRQRKADSSDEEGQRQRSGDGEEDGDGASAVNKPLKAAQGRGISCSSKREATPPKADSSDGEDWEALTGERHEKRNNKDEGSKKTNVLSFSDEKEAAEPTFKLKKSSDKAVVFQVRKKEASPVKATRNAASHSPRQDYDSSPSPYALQHDDSSDGGSDDDKSVQSGSGSSVSSSSGSRLSAADPVIIPKAAEIKAARRQRRANRGQKQFIPLSRDGHSSAASTPDRYNREEEDDDNDDDDDDDDDLDDHERIIEFAPRQKSIRERIAQKLGSEGSLSGTDGEEQELWEETQIGKGVKRRPGEQSPSGSESSSCMSRWDRERQKKRSAGAKIPKIPPAISVSVVKKRITGKLDSLMEVHRARQAELRRMAGDIENARSSVEILEESSSEMQLRFYREMTVYVHNLVECLREKVVEINELELELHTLLSDQMEALLAQRQQRTKEQADRLQQLSYGTDQQSEHSAKGTETQGKASEAKEDTQDIPEDTQPSEEQEEQLQRMMADILSRSQEVFSDVQDDFCDVKKILSRFEEWRASYSDSYHSAYISLCLPKLLNPIIRHQLLAWNPLKDASGDFENLPWFTALETFCHGHGHEELDHTDRQTLSNVIEKTVLPKITVFVELVWDPMSHHQSVCLSEVCHRLKDDYSIFEGEQSKPVKTFMEAVVRRLRSCVDEDVFVPLYPKKFLEDRSSPQCQFREQQFWMAIKLLVNMGKWDLLLPESVLKELMLDKLLNRYLMITLCSQDQSHSTGHACKKIAESLPLSWFSSDLPQIQNFRNYLVEKIHRMCKQQSPKDPKTRSAVVEVLQVLSRLRCHDSIMAIAENYHYEDVIYSHQLLNQEPA